MQTWKLQLANGEECTVTGQRLKIDGGTVIILAQHGVVTAFGPGQWVKVSEVDRGE